VSAPGQAQPALIPSTATSPPAGTPQNDGVMVRVWEYDVPETSRAEFERTYGAAGDWVQLFSSSDGFRGTELFVSLSDPGRYLTVDRFTDEGAWRAFLSEHCDAYARLDAATKGLTDDECELAGGEVG
jgi:heme-degrading monooxygenase HmoA